MNPSEMVQLAKSEHFRRGGAPSFQAAHSSLTVGFSEDTEKAETFLREAFGIESIEWDTSWNQHLNWISFWGAFDRSIALAEEEAE